MKLESSVCRTSASPLLFNAITNAVAESANPIRLHHRAQCGRGGRAGCARLDKLAEMYELTRRPRRIEFVDIAGSIRAPARARAWAMFLENIRRTDAIVHVVRCFDDENIMHVVADASQNEPVDLCWRHRHDRDLEPIMADLEMVNRRIERRRPAAAKGDKQFLREAEVFMALAAHLGCWQVRAHLCV